MAIGLKLPRLFHGRTRRQRIVGVRADFCEFCVCVCRHWIIAYQSAPTVLFMPLTFEESSRESRCEICRTQFPVDPAAPIRHLTGRADLPGPQEALDSLIRETHPEVLDEAAAEARAMLARSRGPELLRENRLRNFFRNHEREYRQRVQVYFPQLAIGSIQAVIVGWGLSLIAPFWLALAFAASLFLFAGLLGWMVLRRRIYRAFQYGIDRLMAVARLSPDEMSRVIDQYAPRFPQAAAIMRQQLREREQSLPLHYEVHQDYVPLLE